MLAEQLDYYRARAAEYDDWFVRRGQFDRGAEENARQFADLRVVEEALQERQGPRAACSNWPAGRGWWTQRLVSGANRLVAVDAAPQMLTLNRERVRDPRVEYVLADLFDWRPEGRFDFVFFGFWLSHVPTIGSKPSGARSPTR